MTSFLRMSGATGIVSSSQSAPWKWCRKAIIKMIHVAAIFLILRYRVKLRGTYPLKLTHVVGREKMFHTKVIEKKITKR